MKIIIKEANTEKITTAITAAEGRATARTITARQIIETAEKITRRLDIPKKSMVGIEADVDIHAQNFPRAYKYIPESTQFRMEYTESGWTLTGVSREHTRRERHAAELTLTEAAKQAVIARAQTISEHEI